MTQIKRDVNCVYGNDVHVFVVGILNMFLKILKSWKSYLPSKTAILRCVIFNMFIYEHSKQTNVM